MTQPHDSPSAPDPADRSTFTHDLTGAEELGTSVTTALAETTGARPDTVGSELSKTVDFDGLDRLFHPPKNDTSRPGGHLVLAVAGCRVTIDTDGTITVEQ